MARFGGRRRARVYDPPMTAPPPTHPLDRLGARLAAGLVAVLALALLAYVHREALSVGDAADSAAETPLARCLAERRAAVDQMVADGVVEAERAALFRARAEALCRDLHPE